MTYPKSGLVSPCGRPAGLSGLGLPGVEGRVCDARPDGLEDAVLLRR
jgi:hypothetical protein